MKTDVELRNDILEELAWEPDVSATRIGVIIDDSIVTLTGCVATSLEKLAAQRAALRVPGVKVVANEIKLIQSNDSQLLDKDIASNVYKSLDLNVLLPEDLQAVVEAGWVTLTGKVQWQFQKTAAQNAVEYLLGVKGVTNSITFRPNVKPSDVNKKIETMFQHEADAEAKRIRVQIKEGKISLEGTVSSLAEKIEVEDATWSVPGVTEVENKLVIVKQGLE